MCEARTTAYFPNVKNELNVDRLKESINSESPDLFANQINMLPHFNCMTKNSLEMYTCEICHTKVYLKVNLQVHIELMHTPGSEVSLEKFFQLSDANYNLTNILKQYTCKNCDFRTFSLLVLLKHIVKHPRHPEKNIFEANTTLWRSNYDSNNCETKSERYLVKHKFSEHIDPKSVKWLKCDQCLMKTLCHKNLEKHVQTAHAPPGPPKWYVCDLCPFKTRYRSNWRLHKFYQHSESRDVRLFECTFCSYKAKQKKHLQTHVISKHTAPEDVKWFECEHCEYKAKQKCTLNAHVLARHTASEKIRWFNCEMCDFKCKRKTHLKQHMLRHSDHKPMLCEICSCQFKRLVYLREHMKRMHNQ